MLLMKAPAAQGGNVLSFAQPALLGNAAPSLFSLRKCIARLHISAAEPLLEPIHALLRRAMRE